jgi:hypothetical protein
MASVGEEWREPMTTQARGVTRPPLTEDVLARMREAHKHDSFLEGCQIALEGREDQLTASLEREAALRAEVERLRGKPFSDRMYAALESRLAAAQNAALARENEQSAMDAATVEERFELRERLRVCERALEIAKMYILDHGNDSNMASVIDAIEHAELQKEKANG